MLKAAAKKIENYTAAQAHTYKTPYDKGFADGQQSTPKQAAEFSADTPANRQRHHRIDYLVPHHPIVTWQDWLCFIESMHKTEAMLMKSIEHMVIPEEIAAFKTLLSMQNEPRRLRADVPAKFTGQKTTSQRPKQR